MPICMVISNCTTAWYVHIWTPLTHAHRTHTHTQHTHTHTHSTHTCTYACTQHIRTYIHTLKYIHTRSNTHIHITHALTSSVEVIERRSFSNWEFCSSAVAARALASSFSAVILCRLSPRSANSACAICSCSFMQTQHQKLSMFVLCASYLLTIALLYT